MCYVCGKSRNKIIHSENCRYMKQVPEKNRRYFYNIKDAEYEGYSRCKYCSPIRQYLDKEQDALNRYCERNGLYYCFNPQGGTIDVISQNGKWKIIVNGKRNFIFLYHKNTHSSTSESLVPGYHSQNVRRSSLLGYMKCIAEHDIYREKFPLYEDSKTGIRKGSKKWKSKCRHQTQRRKRQEIKHVLDLMDQITVAN